MFENSRAFSGFSTDDIPATQAFYELLGVRVTSANGMLTLHTAGDRETLIYPKRDHLPATYTVLNFAVGDIDEAVDQLAALGVSLLRYEGLDERGVQRGYGPSIAWFTDPGGNILSVIQQV